MFNDDYYVILKIILTNDCVVFIFKNRGYKSILLNKYINLSLFFFGIFQCVHHVQERCIEWGGGLVFLTVC